ncbi:PREDICTED: uncharacterized protein LOC105151722 [Acromyrmex echinatior]|uniref:uncharacterized protein LOC105151722 n=1 Tax=Acromyrmex echinatior TaxID=103372 RepID=UPI000580C6A7|nr:PREDICTED: uncharacterized protein LOC105151722 [Acromyrmex echinatior]
MRGGKSDNISTGYDPRNARVLGAPSSLVVASRRVASRRGPQGPQNNAPCLLRDCGYIRSDARSHIQGVPRQSRAAGRNGILSRCKGLKISRTRACSRVKGISNLRGGLQAHSEEKKQTVKRGFPCERYRVREVNSARRRSGGDPDGTQRSAGVRDHSMIGHAHTG